MSANVATVVSLRLLGLNMIPEFIKSFFCGKKVTKSFNVGFSQAIINVDNKIHKITRNGRINNWGKLGVFVISSKDLLTEYMSDSKRQILVDDMGFMFAVCSIDSIDVMHRDVWDFTTWRE